METKQENVIPTDYAEVMQKSYIDYAMSVIISRALPDVRDGLKPVQRRTLYDMYELGIRYDRPYRKCARIVGDTMGKYHPHGDSSIYEALVVMAQDFKKGKTLVDGHGNFGSIEGDGAAAMRYTEARLEKLTQDVFLSAYKNLSRFDGTYEKAWLSKIAVRKCLDHLKAAGRRTIPTEDTYFEQLHDKEFSPEEAFLDKDFKDRIRHLCSALKSPYREVALEHFCEEKTAAEIAKAQNKNIKTVQTQIYRSRSMLKALLERSD